MEEGCRLCLVPQEEGVIYSDDLCYVAPTKDLKGHKVRMMVVLQRHSAEPTIHEFYHCADALRRCMEQASTDPSYFVVYGSHASIPDHWHAIGCDTTLTPAEEAALRISDHALVSRMRVLIGIPAHNEEGKVGYVTRSAQKYGDVYVLANACTDGTAAEATTTGAKVKVTERGGYGFALSEIFTYAKAQNYDALVTLDGDGQHDPFDAPQLIAKLRGADVVVGNRFTAGSEVPLHRRAVITALNAAYGVGDTQNGFRAYGRRAIEAITVADTGMGASLEILAKAREAGLRVVEAPCTIRYDDPEPPATRVIRQGMELVEQLFWGYVWARPYTVLGIPAATMLLASLVFFLMLAAEYGTKHYFALNLALLGGVALMGGLLLTIATFFITIQRRLLREMKVK